MASKELAAAPGEDQGGVLNKGKIIIEDLLLALGEKDVLDYELQVLGVDLKSRIQELQAELENISAGTKDKISAVNRTIAEHKQSLAEGWEDMVGPDTSQTTHDGFLITRKANKRAIVTEGEEMELVRSLTMIMDADKVPFTVKFNSRKLVKAIDLGVVLESQATVEVQHSISITPPKVSE